jgi:hypothetical protein
MSLGQWRDLVLMSLLGMVGFTVLMFEGLKRTAAADAGIITATLPAVVALMGMALGERLSRLQAAAIALAVVGLGLVHAGSTSAGTSTLVGNLLVGGAVLCEASFVLLGKRLTPPFRPLRLALGANLVGLVLALPFALTELPGFDASTITLEMWGVGHVVRTGGERHLPVALVSRPAVRRDLAGRTGDGRNPDRRAGAVRALSRRDDRQPAARRRGDGDRGHRARGDGARPPPGASAAMTGPTGAFRTSIQSCR